MHECCQPSQQSTFNHVLAVVLLYFSPLHFEVLPFHFDAIARSFVCSLPWCRFCDSPSSSCLFHVSLCFVVVHHHFSSLETLSSSVCLSSCVFRASSGLDHIRYIQSRSILNDSSENTSSNAVRPSHRHEMEIRRRVFWWCKMTHVERQKSYLVTWTMDGCRYWCWTVFWFSSFSKTQQVRVGFHSTTSLDFFVDFIHSFESSSLSYHHTSSSNSKHMLDLLLHLHRLPPVSTRTFPRSFYAIPQIHQSERQHLPSNRPLFILLFCESLMNSILEGMKLCWYMIWSLARYW